MWVSVPQKTALREPIIILDAELFGGHFFGGQFLIACGSCGRKVIGTSASVHIHDP